MFEEANLIKKNSAAWKLQSQRAKTTQPDGYVFPRTFAIEDPYADQPQNELGAQKKVARQQKIVGSGLVIFKR